MDNYISDKKAVEKWGTSERMVRRYCTQGRIENAQQGERGWLIPWDAQKPKMIVVEKREPEIWLPQLVRRIRYQRKRNNHFGIYEYIQIELSYHSNRSTLSPTTTAAWAISFC